MGLIQAGSVSQIDGRVVNVTDGAAGDTYFYFSLGEQGFRFFSLQYTITAFTLKLEVTNDSDVSSTPAVLADASKTWTDVTNALFGVVSVTTSGIWIVDTPLAVAKCRLVYTRSLATNSLAVRLTRAT
jgi:hypothetical protein